MCFSNKKVRIKDSKSIFGNQLRKKSLKNNARSSFLAQLTLSLLIQFDKAVCDFSLGELDIVRTQNWQVSSDRSDLWVPPVRAVWLKSTKIYLDFTIG
jgi:hypothetical protein